MNIRRTLFAITAFALVATLSPATFAGEKKAKKPTTGKLTISLDSLPNFIFSDKPMLLPVCLRRDVQPPKLAKNRKHGTLKAAVTMRLVGGRELKSEKLVPLYNDIAATAFFPVDAHELSHESTVEVQAKFEKKTPVHDKLMIINLGMKFKTDPTLSLGHFYTKDGTRIMFLIPRASESARRRWFPLRAGITLAESASENSVLLIGSECGDSGYSKILETDIKARDMQFRKKLFACKKNAPVHELFITALMERNAKEKRLVLFPGNRDISFGTPLDEYYMTLQAVCSIFAQEEIPAAPIKGIPPISPITEILIATPPPMQRHKTAVAAYTEVIARVARERHAEIADLGQMHWLSPTKKIAQGIENAIPEKDAQKVFGKQIARMIAEQDSGQAAIPVMALFLICSLSLIWLWLRGRYTPPKQD